MAYINGYNIKYHFLLTNFAVITGKTSCTNARILVKSIYARSTVVTGMADTVVNICKKNIYIEIKCARGTVFTSNSVWL